MNKLLLSFLILMLGISPALANRAQTLLIPQRVVMNNGDRFATIMLKNSGDATGEFRIDLIDMNMEENGTINEVPEGTPPTEFSAIPLIRLSPRSVTLRPQEEQIIRILLRKPEGLADGEYRSHVKVSIINNNVDGTPDEVAKRQLTVEARIILIMPLIVRNGQTSFTASLSEAHVEKNPSAPGSVLSLYVGREGNRSSMGDLKIFQNGQQVGELNGLPVYRPTARRLVRVPLPNVTGGGPLTVKYMQSPADGTAVLAETTTR